MTGPMRQITVEELLKTHSRRKSETVKREEASSNRPKSKPESGRRQGVKHKLRGTGTAVSWMPQEGMIANLGCVNTDSPKGKAGKKLVANKSSKQ